MPGLAMARKNDGLTSRCAFLCHTLGILKRRDAVSLCVGPGCILRKSDASDVGGIGLSYLRRNARVATLANLTQGYGVEPAQQRSIENSSVEAFYWVKFLLRVQKRLFGIALVSLTRCSWLSVLSVVCLGDAV